MRLKSEISSAPFWFKMAHYNLAIIKFFSWSEQGIPKKKKLDKNFNWNIMLQYQTIFCLSLLHAYFFQLRLTQRLDLLLNEIQGHNLVLLSQGQGHMKLYKGLLLLLPLHGDG